MSQIKVMHNRKYRSATIIATLDSYILIYQTEAVANPVYIIATNKTEYKNSEFIEGQKGTGYIRTYSSNKLPKKWSKLIE
jgi:hypothetical protein